MKSERKNLLVPIVTFSAGAVGVLLRALLYLTGLDEKGLMSNSHPLHMLCWVLAVGVAVFLGVSIRKLDGTDRYEDNFPAGSQNMMGIILAPIWFLTSAFSTLDHISDRIDVVWTVLSFAAVPCLLYTGWCRMKGKHPSFIFHTVVCVFFAIDMVCRYRTWSGNPHLPDYSFQIFACVFLTLTAYQRAAFDVGLGKRKMLLFCSLMAAFFCMLSLGPEDSSSYIGGAVWVIANLPAMDAPAAPDGEIQEES